MEDTFELVKITPLVDCSTGAILDIHCAKTLPHDTHIGWQVLTRNINKVDTVVADEGFDWNDLRPRLREEGIRPIIKHKEFYHLDKAHTGRMDDDVYHLRSNVESAFFAIRHRYGDKLGARTWFGQFRELVLKAAVRNLELPVRD